MNRGVAVALATAAALLTFSGPACAADRGWDLILLRTGADDRQPSEDFTQFDAHVAYELAPISVSSSGWRFGPHLEAQGGVLSAADASAVVLSAGPALSLTSPRRHFSFRFGISPTVLGDHEFGRMDLGSHFHFTSHVGVSFGVGRAVLVYRFQHTSNADIWPVNPGLNMHLLGVGWRR